MKKHLWFCIPIKSGLILSVMYGLTYGAAIAQTNSIPNGNFESWTSGTYEYPANYPYNSNGEGFWKQIPFNLTKITDAYQGTYAVQLTTNNLGTDTSGGYFICGNPSGQNWHGGFPYSQIPTGISGYYKCNILPGDSALIVASFSKSGNNIGQYFFKIGGVKTTYTLFNFTFSPALSTAPDSVIFGATSSDFVSNVVKVGSTLKLDNVSFTGVVSQPSLLNGSFESWQNQTLYSPDNWYSDWGVNRTSDFADGNYAMELITYPGESDGNAQARAGQISTGYYDKKCNCMKGGYPFSNQIDTLVFSYKYTPASNDSAEVYLNFKKNGSGIWGLNKKLAASASYQFVSIPFNIGQAPDTVIVEIRSSLWQDTLLSYVGSVLKIDEIHFKSQPLNTGVLELQNDNQLMLYPNPCKDGFSVIVKDRAVSIEKITLFDLLGNIVEGRYFENNSARFTENFDAGKLSAGFYIIQVNTKSGIYRRKLNKIE